MGGKWGKVGVELACSPATSEPPPLPSFPGWVPLSIYISSHSVPEHGVWGRNMDGEKGEKMLGTLKGLTDLGAGPPPLSVLPITIRLALFYTVKWCLWVLTKRSFKTPISPPPIAETYNQLTLPEGNCVRERGGDQVSLAAGNKGLLRA